MIRPLGIREPARPVEYVVDPAEWTAEEVAKEPRLVVRWRPEDLEEFRRAVRHVEDNNLDVAALAPSHFPLSHQLVERLGQVQRELVDGLGIQLLRGLPTDELTREQQIILFFGIGCYLGKPLSQNRHGHLVGHVKDVGASKEDPNFRTYQTRDKLSFHSDSCDITGLMCLQKAASGGESLVTSSIAMYNEILCMHPELVDVLMRPFHVDRRGEVPEGASPTYQLPIFNFKDGYLSIKGGRTYVDSAQRFPEVPRLTDAQVRALDLFELLARDMSFRMQFEPGDIQLINNHVTVHSRNAYEDSPEVGQRRHLLRLWLTIPGMRPLTEPYSERFNTGVLVAGTRPVIALDVD